MKRLLSLILTVALVLSIALFGLFEITASAVTSDFGGGDGTESSPYLISTAVHLSNVRNYRDAHFKMVCNINLSTSNWSPIGSTDSKAFTGTFDGNGCVIRNLCIQSLEKYGYLAGLFGCNKGTIKNLYIEDCQISISDSGSSNVSASAIAGGIAAWNEGTITNCYTIGTIYASADAWTAYTEVGGIAGYNNGTITKCYNLGTISGRSYASGSQYSTGYGETYVGGITGYNENIVTDCHNAGDISAVAYKSSAYSETYAYACAGGIVGYNKGTTSNCYNTSIVTSTADNSARAGAVAGYTSGKTTACYFLDSMARGVGSGTDTTTKCTAEQMGQQSTYAGFDFENVWDFNTVIQPYPIIKNIHYHRYDSVCDTSCNDCLYKRTAPHDYNWVIDKENNCSVDGVKHEECTVCQLKRNENTVISATGEHTYDNACDTACNVCGKTRTVLHDYQWIIDQENNCGDDGVKHAECSVCKATRYEGTVIAATGEHSYDNICDAVCNVCKQSRTAPHDYAWVIDKENNCGFDGMKHEECSACHAKRNEQTIIPLTNDHTVTDEQEMLCDVCGRQCYKILFDGNGGTSVDAIITVPEVTITLPSEMPTRQGYAFAGWSLSKNGDVDYQPEAEMFVKNEVTTLYAQWNKNCSKCGGDGRENYSEKCTNCNGKGTVESSTACTKCGGDGKMGVSVDCTTCSGTGKTNQKCSHCYGRGRRCAQCGNASETIIQGLGSVCSNCWSTSTTTCTWCSGKGTWKGNCSKCGGDGKVIQDNAQTCTSCSGAGYPQVDCSHCYRGYADKTRSCAACNATGEVIRESVSTPDAPAVQGYDENVVTLQEITNGEYSIDGVDWQESPVFEGIECGKEYTFYQRYAKTDTTLRSASSTGLTITMQHSFGDWSVHTPATCTEDGEEGRRCTSCDYYEIQVIEASGHSLGEWEVYTEPTCTEDGEERKQCENCDYYESQVIESADHSLGQWEVYRESTCTEDGEERKQCANCDYYESQVIEATGHSLRQWEVYTEPTCTKNGEERKQCANCDYYKSQVLEATGHSLSQWEVYTEPTCTKNGEERKQCANCDYYESQVIEATGHSLSQWEVYTEPTCTKNGEERKQCANCDYFESQEIDPMGHDYDNGICRRCGKDENAIYNGLVVVDGVWGYYEGGVLQEDYTGLVPYGDILFYVENGILDFAYTGLVWHNDAWRYVANSQLTEGYTGLVWFNDNWFYTVDSVIDWTFTGLVPYEGNYFYVQNNLLDWSYTGLGYHDGGWYFIQNGLLQKEYSGLVYFNDNWFYVEEGVLTYQYFGMVEYQGNLFYVQASHLDWSYTGLGYHEGNWYYFQNALYTPDYNGMVDFNGSTFYVEGGIVDWSVNGLREFEGKLYYIRESVFDNTFNGEAEYDGAIYTVVDGVVEL